MGGWLRSNPGKTVTIYDISSVVNEAQMSAVILRNILSGLQSTEIYPFNRELFSDIDFAPAVTTYHDIKIDQATVGSSSQPKSSEPEKQMQADPPVSESTCCTSPANLPETNGSYVSPAALHPVLKAEACKMTSKGRKRGRTKILADTPVRDEIASAIKVNPKKQTTSSEPAAKKFLFNVSDVHVDEAEETGASAGSHSSLSESDLELNNESDDAIDKMVIMEGDFVVIKIAGKSSIVHYTARIDVIDCKEYKSIFLQKVPSRVDSEETTFVPNPADEAFLPEEDIVYKLPQLRSAGGSCRLSGHIIFKCNSVKWHLK